MYQFVTSKPALAEQSLTCHAEVTYFINNNNVYAAYEVGFYIKCSKCEWCRYLPE